MLSENECKNSGGWFKNPFTGADITADYPRAVTCKPGEKWKQPAVMFQDGTLAKISGRCWNDEERDCYKEYRGKPKTDKSVVKQTVKQAVKKEIFDDSAEKELVKYDENSAMSSETMNVLNECDMIIGISQIAGISYVLLTKEKSNKVYHIPRSLIPDSIMNRFGGIA